jgi:hypothetical protein
MDDRSLRRFRLGFLLITYVLFALAGARSVVATERGLSDLVIGILVAIAVTKSCVMDSRLIGKPLPRTARWVMFLMWPLAAPVYLLWARGWAGLGWAVLHGVAMLVAIGAGGGLGGAFVPG